MFSTLFKVNFNWSFFGIMALLIKLFFPEISWYSYFAFLISLHQFCLLFFSLGSVIPVRYIMGAFMCLQMLLGPGFAFNGLDQYQRDHYQMQIPEADYFSYVIPAVICFILGLHITAKRLEGEVIDVDAISDYADSNPYLAYYFIGFGFAASFLSQIVASELGFFFLILSNLKFIGAFLIMMRRNQLHIAPLIIVFASIIMSSLIGGMFHDLFTWIIFIGAVFSIKYKPKTSAKLVGTFVCIVAVLAVQQIKGSYREETWKKGAEGGLNLLEDVVEAKREKGTFFSARSIAESNLRINQGFIITHIMKTVPAIVPFADGEEMNQILEAGILPRFLAPDKLTAGNRDIFMKYSGMRLRRGTSMALSSVGDAYINYGRFGGCVFMFLLGLMFSHILKILYKSSKNYPIVLLFTGMMFYYPIRPDCELQTILGHLFKSGLVVWGLLLLLKQVENKPKPNVSLTPTPA